MNEIKAAKDNADEIRNIKKKYGIEGNSAMHFYSRANKAPGTLERVGKV